MVRNKLDVAEGTTATTGTHVSRALACAQRLHVINGIGGRDSRHEASPMRLCAESGWPHTPPAPEETTQERGDRRRKMREGRAAWVRMHVGMEGAPFTDARAELRAPWPDEVSDEVKDALHPVRAIAEAQLAFAKDQHNSGAASTCDVCIDVRNTWDHSSAVDGLPNVVGCNKLHMGDVWAARRSPHMNKRLVCQRCVNLNAPKERGGKEGSPEQRAHPFSDSGINSPPQDCSPAGQHNNMHMLPTPAYLAELNQFELSIISPPCRKSPKKGRALPTPARSN